MELQAPREYVNPEEAKIFQQECKTFYYEKQFDLIDKPAPAANRQCTDTFCMIAFVLILAAFVTYSSISIHSVVTKNLITLNHNDNFTFLRGITQKELERLGIIVALCIAGSVVLGIIVMLSLRLCPQTTIKLLAFVTLVTTAGQGLVIGFIFQNWSCSIFFIMTVGFFVFMTKFWDNLRKAAILMKTVGNFISDNPRILLLLFFALLYCVVILFLWVGGFYSFCMRYSHGELSFEGFLISFICWVFMLIFFNFYFYYTSVFITANAVAIWFFDKTDEFDVTTSPLKLMVRYHLGTITFASIVITLGKILKLCFKLASFQSSQNDVASLIGSVVKFIVSCCLGSLEAMVQVVNNYSVIMCSLTGHKLLDSAKIVGQLVFNDPQNVFNDFTYNTYVVNSGGVLAISMIPTLVGAILLSSYSTPIWSFSIAMIFFASSIIGLLMLQIFVESASTLFLLYTLDGKLSEEGLNVVWIDKFATQLEKSFDEAYVGKIQKKKIKTRNITTVIVYGDGAVHAFKETVPDKNQDLHKSHLQPYNPFSVSQNNLIT